MIDDPHFELALGWALFGAMITLVIIALTSGLAHAVGEKQQHKSKCKPTAGGDKS